MIDNGKETTGQDRVGVATELPALAAGPVAALTAAGGDGWLTAAAGPLSPIFLGAFVELANGAGAPPAIRN